MCPVDVTRGGVPDPYRATLILNSVRRFMRTLDRHFCHLVYHYAGFLVPDGGVFSSSLYSNNTLL